MPSGPLSNYCKLKIIYADNANATDTSEDYFRLRGAITVDTPYDGQSWQIGQATNVTWTRQGNIAAVNILYSTDGGGNWTTLPNAAGINASGGIWPWNIIPSTNTTTQGKIRVADANNPDIDFGTSGGTFSIKGSLNLTNPSNAGVVMTYDGSSSYNITWTKEGGISLVNLSYSTNGGTSYGNVIENNVSATSSPYPWPIPNAIGANLKVKVAVEGDSSVNSSSLNNFAIKGDIWVTSPNGNESWLVGSGHNITWNTTGTYPATVQIYFSDNNGTNWTEISEVPTQDKIWYWDSVPDNITTNALIKVATNTSNSSIDVNDTSNETFKVRGSVTVLEPNGNDHWFVNETNRQIRWDAVGTVTPVKIEYSTGGSYMLITNNYTGVSGSTNAYNWTPIPDNKSETCLVRVSDNRTAFTSEVTDVSNANFTILPKISIYLPAGNDNVTAGASGTQPIRWNYTGHTIERVNIDYL